MLPKGNRANFIFWHFVSPDSIFYAGIRKYPPIGAKNTTYFCVGGVVVALLADAARGAEHGWRGKSYAR